MKSKLLSLLAIAMIGLSTNAFAQTDGTLAVSYTIPVPTSPAPWTGGTTNTCYYVAYITDATTGNLVREILLYTGKKDHLSQFAQKAGCALVTTSTPNYYNVLDIVTADCVNNKKNAVVPYDTTLTTFVSGATRTDSTTPKGFGTISFTWDGKKYDPATNTLSIAPDGNYKVNVDMSWSTTVARDGNDERLVIPFTKTSTIFDATPVTDTYVTASSAKWTPSILATNDVIRKNEFKVFPNPASDKFSVKTLDNVKVVNLMDASGRLVKSYSKSETYDISNLKPGVYYLEIITVDGVAYNKVVKK